ncbi:uncharacterized protein LOC144703338 [Wolffia australiana]
MSTMAATSSPCAACKFLRRKCVPGCVFAPYFPQEKMDKFVMVHRVFGASNVGKILSEIAPENGPDAVKSLCNEAKIHIKDPVHGCSGCIRALQGELLWINQKIGVVKAEINAILNPESAPPPPPCSAHVPTALYAAWGVMQEMGFPPLNPGSCDSLPALSDILKNQGPTTAMDASILQNDPTDEDISTYFNDSAFAVAEVPHNCPPPTDGMRCDEDSATMIAFPPENHPTEADNEGCDIDLLTLLSSIPEDYPMEDDVAQYIVDPAAMDAGVPEDHPTAPDVSIYTDDPDLMVASVPQNHPMPSDVLRYNGGPNATFVSVQLNHPQPADGVRYNGDPTTMVNSVQYNSPH